MKTRQRWKRPAAKRGMRRRAPVAAAEEAGLRYVTDTSPGISRRRAGKGFSYRGPDGRPIRDARTLARIRSLAIPPAYTGVWICPDPSGHLQATGRDARGRKQYRYHPRWRAVRDETKFERMLAFSEVLPRIRQRVQRDLARSGLPRAKVLATIVRLLECTGIRVGNDEYARDNGSFGLTTLRDRHVEVSGSKLQFEFRGKSGKSHSVSLSDRRLARVVQRCQALPGAVLFQYVDDGGDQQTIGSGDVNDYLREASGQDFTAKDFRTWSGTILAVRALRELGPADGDKATKATKASILAAIDRVAEQLNNTRAVCRKYYVHPAVFETYAAGTMLDRLANGKPGAASKLSTEEQAVVRLLTPKG